MHAKTAGLLFIGVLLVFTISIDSVSANAAENIEITTPFPRVSIDAGRSLVHKIRIRNTGDREEVIDLLIKKPPEWRAYLQDGGYEVKSLYLASGAEQSIDMVIYSPPTAESGSYNFELIATSADNTVSKSLSIVVEIRTTFEREIEVYCPNPVIEGPSTKRFEFTVEVVNRGEAKTISYNLVYPEGWEASVMERYGETILRSQSFTAQESRTVKLVVSPPERASEGGYPVKFIASYGDTHVEIELTIALTGIYDVSITTKTGLLSTTATCGEDTSLVVVVTDEGTGILRDIILSTPREPFGWEVTFDPKIIPALSPGESRDVILTIKPALDTLPGDYALEVGAYTGTPYYRSDSFGLRVSVSAPTAWGYIGGIVIGATLLGFLLIFWRFGRR